MRNFENRKEDKEENKLRIDHTMCSRGEENETPNLVLIGFKSFFRDMYDSGEAAAMKVSKKDILQKEVPGMWYFFF